MKCESCVFYSKIFGECGLGKDNSDCDVVKACESAREIIDELRSELDG